MLSFYLAVLNTSEERDRITYLYDKYHQLLLKFAVKILGDNGAAEDAVHDTFIAAIESDRKILMQEEVNFRNWSVTVVKRKCFDILRRQKRLGYAAQLDMDAVSELTSDDVPLDIQIANREDYERLVDCIAELEPLNRQILEMKYMHELSFDEICAKLNMTFPQVNGRLTRTREKIKKMFGKKEG
ncbi:MAG: sigma-70 family RNA polymerase sigma factor [Clostridium sp.]|jgi:RNA polymerase sigma-70 factor (ECF subfamily)|nr:sigma-70 family RNA polymerase sigma factor [Clostridium sp.]